jgi:hypothetical protein
MDELNISSFRRRSWDSIQHDRDLDSWLLSTDLKSSTQQQQNRYADSLTFSDTISTDRPGDIPKSAINGFADSYERDANQSMDSPFNGPGLDSSENSLALSDSHNLDEAT